jgi:hypothetical protein
MKWPSGVFVYRRVEASLDGAGRTGHVAVQHGHQRRNLDPVDFAADTKHGADLAGVVSADLQLLARE